MSRDPTAGQPGNNPQPLCGHTFDEGVDHGPQGRQGQVDVAAFPQYLPLGTHTPPTDASPAFPKPIRPPAAQPRLLPSRVPKGGGTGCDTQRATRNTRHATWAPVLLWRSDPARSTRFSLEVTTRALPSSHRAVTSVKTVKMECDREESAAGRGE